MPNLVIVYWRDIPAQVIAEKGRGRKKVSFKVELNDRFIKAIDSAAMNKGVTDTDEYLSNWRRAQPIACGEDLETEVKNMAMRLDGNYTQVRLLELIKNSGLEVIYPALGRY